MPQSAGSCRLFRRAVRPVPENDGTPARVQGAGFALLLLWQAGYREPSVQRRGVLYRNGRRTPLQAKLAPRSARSSRSTER